MAGGSIYLVLPGNLTIASSVFSLNNAQDGSALYYEETDEKTLILESTIFYLNIAYENGAALFVSISTYIIIANCSIIENLIQKNQTIMGSVIFLNNPGNISITFSNFQSNKGIMGTCIYYSELRKLKKNFCFSFL